MVKIAVELATGYISLVPTTRGFGRSLRHEFDPLEREGTNVGDRTARNFGRTFTAGVATAATRGAVALAGGFALAAGVGIKIAADFEQTQIAFEGILGSADEANRVLGDLRTFANKTPFEFTGLTDSAKTLLGVGFAADDIIPTMTTLGNVAATLGVGEPEIKGVVRALGQIKGKGKASAEELQQISEQIPGFSAINAIAEELGVTTAEAFDLMAAGAIPADQAIEAILGGMEKFPGASGAMERQSKTLNGVISTFKDTLSTTAIDFITPYLPAISSGVAAFGGFIQNSAVPALGGFVDFISDEVVPGIESLVNLFDEEGLGGVIGRIGDIIAENAPILGEKLLALGAELVNWVAPQIPPLLGALGNVLGDVASWILNPGIGLLADAVAPLIPAAISWLTDEDTLDAFGDFLDAFVDWVITDGIPGFVEAGKDLGAALAKGIGEGLKELGLSVLLGSDDNGAEFLKPRAEGGPVQAGRPYIVGEHRPELFVPSTSGEILPSVPDWSSSVGGVTTVNIYNPISEDPEHSVMRGLRRQAAMT